MQKIALENALELKIIQSKFKENQLSISKLQERQKPKLAASALLPNLSRSIQLRPLPDGQDAFVNQSTMTNNLSLDLSYQIMATGGTLRASSNLSRLDVFKTESFDYRRSFFFTPIALQYSQPLFQFNEIKWSNERLELLNAELVGQQAYIRETILGRTVELYTNAFKAQIQIQLGQQKIKEIEALYKIKTALAQLGKVEKIELLRLESERESTLNSLQENLLDWENARVEICDFLQLERDQTIDIIAPNSLSSIYISPESAVVLALENTYINAKNRLKIRNAETEIERANREDGIEFSIDLSLGLNNTDDNFSQLAQNLLDRQTLAIQVRVPILNGKERNIQKQIAKEQLFQEQTAIEQEQIDLSREVLENLRSFNLSTESLAFLSKNRRITEEIFQLTLDQYRLGQKSITELNIARSERDQAQLRYYEELLDAVANYYTLRKLCLYDFINQRSLVK
jgi:outer membrane protein TolC